MQQPPEITCPTLPADLEALFPHTADVQGVDAMPFYVGMPLDEMIASYEVTQDWLRAHPLPTPVPFWTRHARLRVGLVIAGASVASVGVFAGLIGVGMWVLTLLQSAPTPFVAMPTDNFLPTAGTVDALGTSIITKAFLPSMVLMGGMALAVRMIFGR